MAAGSILLISVGLLVYWAARARLLLVRPPGEISRALDGDLRLTRQAVPLLRLWKNTR